MSKNGQRDRKKVEGTWYPGELAPHLFYVRGELSGMAAAIPRIWGENQKWEAFDMRRRNASDSGPFFLGEHESVQLAKQQIEKAVLVIDSSL